MIWLLSSIAFLMVVLIACLLCETRQSQVELKRLEWLNSAYPPLTPEQQAQAEDSMRQWERRQFKRMSK